MSLLQLSSKPTSVTVNVLHVTAATLKEATLCHCPSVTCHICNSQRSHSLSLSWGYLSQLQLQKKALSVTVQVLPVTVPVLPVTSATLKETTLSHCPGATCHCCNSQRSHTLSLSQSYMSLLQLSKKPPSVTVPELHVTATTVKEATLCHCPRVTCHCYNCQRNHPCHCPRVTCHCYNCQGSHPLSLSRCYQFPSTNIESFAIQSAPDKNVSFQLYQFISHTHHKLLPFTAELNQPSTIHFTYIHTVQSMDTPFNLCTHRSIYGHTVQSMYTPFNLWTHRSIYGHTVESMDTPFNLWTHRSIYGHTVQSMYILFNLCTQCLIYGHTVQSMYILFNLCTHRSIYIHNVYLCTHLPIYIH